MAIVAYDDGPVPPEGEERLALERASRAMLRIIYAEILRDRWDLVLDLWEECEDEGEWFAIAVWAGLPNTVRERIRELKDHETS